jgi:hypothetical protein
MTGCRGHRVVTATEASVAPIEGWLMLDSRIRTARLIAMIALGALALSGCSAFSTTDTHLSLAESKSPVQLLRNAAAGRVPDVLINEVLNATDQSVACRTPETDPEGLLRQWRSTIRLELADGADADAVIDELTSSFVEQGWAEGIYGTKSIIELTRGTSGSVIHVSGTAADDENGTMAELQVQVSGPCVMTAGEGSSEVALLGANG